MFIANHSLGIISVNADLKEQLIAVEGTGTS